MSRNEYRSAMVAHRHLTAAALPHGWQAELARRDAARAAALRRHREPVGFIARILAVLF